MAPTCEKKFQIKLTPKNFLLKIFKCEKLTDDRRQTPSDGKSSHCLCMVHTPFLLQGLWQGELKRP
jgi:hypothetical protein